MKTAKPPRRLRIKKYSRIAGVLEGKILSSGMYVENANIDTDTFDKLLSPQFQHAVEPLPDVEPEPELATPVDAPQENEGDKYRRELREKAELERAERWRDGKPFQYHLHD